jgi:hypothetical protein
LWGPNIAVYFHQEIGLIYKHTTPDSPLRKGVVNAICAGEDNNEESLMEYPKELLADVILHRKKEVATWKEMMKTLEVDDGSAGHKRKRLTFQGARFEVARAGASTTDVSYMSHPEF